MFKFFNGWQSGIFMIVSKISELLTFTDIRPAENRYSLTVTVFVTYWFYMKHKVKEQKTWTSSIMGPGGLSPWWGPGAKPRQDMTPFGQEDKSKTLGDESPRPPLFFKIQKFNRACFGMHSFMSGLCPEPLPGALPLDPTRGIIPLDP